MKTALTHLGVTVALCVLPLNASAHKIIGAALAQFAQPTDVQITK
ncbi:hypothetical protein [Lichenifustis flavocetrariae]|nr:hypothetical protein [Lichenifustis flavocetrariae]